VVTAGGGVIRGGIIRFGPPSRGTGGTGASLVSGATVGVGKIDRGGAVGRLTGGTVDDGFDAGSVTSEAVALGNGLVAGGGVRRGGMVRLGTSRGPEGRAVSLVSAGVTEGAGKTVRAGGVPRLTGATVGNGFAAVSSVALTGVAVGAGVFTGGGGTLR
jgi:hypothetical protein